MRAEIRRCGIIRTLAAVVLAMILAGTFISAEEPKMVVPKATPQYQKTAAEARDSTRSSQFQARDPRYQLRKDDVIEVAFPLTSEFDQTVMVQPDGYITLLGAGDLHVEGQTVPELTESIRAAFSKILNAPIVTVRLKDFEKPSFVAGGELAHPGKYELRGDTTAVQAIAIAGGFTESSKHSQVWLFRRVSNDWVETRKIDIKKMLRTGMLKEDTLLRPGDMLYVPKNNFSKIKHFIPVASLGSYVSP